MEIGDIQIVMHHQDLIGATAPNPKQQAQQYSKTKHGDRYEIRSHQETGNSSRRKRTGGTRKGGQTTKTSAGKGDLSENDASEKISYMSGKAGAQVVDDTDEYEVISAPVANTRHRHRQQPVH